VESRCAKESNMKVWHAPLGKLIKGHVLDVNVNRFTETLKHYDNQLYVKWNPKKIRGHGCWEIRRHPNKKTATPVATYKGMTIQKVEYKENDLVHHVLDCAFLNYDALRRIKEMDAWSDKYWVDNLEKNEVASKQKHELKQLEEFRYTLKQHKSLASDLYEAVRSGIPLSQILGAAKWQY